MEWIENTPENKPAQKAIVLVTVRYNKEKNIVLMATYYLSGWVADSIIADIKIIAWMPLPEPFVKP